MAKLEIKKREGTQGLSQGLSMRDYDILIDGNEISALTGIEISMEVDSFNEATISFFVESLKVDGDFLAILKAKADNETNVVETGNDGEWKTFDYSDKKE